MQDINDPNVKEASKDAEPVVQEKADLPSRKSRLRDRSGQKSGGAASTVSTETIGEIQLPPGEALKDDLTANTDVARSKGGSNRRDSQGERSSREGRDRDGGGRERRGRERRSGHGEHRSRRSEHGGRERHSDSDNREQRETSDQRHGKKSGQDRSNQKRRGHGRSSGRPDRSGRRDRSRKSETSTSEDVKPATWNAGEAKSEGFFGKAGKLFSSIFGGNESTATPKSTESSESRENRGKGRRRRSRSGNRGGQPRS